MGEQLIRIFWKSQTERKIEKMSKADKIDIALDDIIKTDKSSKKNLGKGGRSTNNNQGKAKKGSNVRQAAKKASLANKGKPTNQRAGLRPRVQPGKAKTTFKAAKAPQGKLKSPAKKTANQGKAKAISQALALKDSTRPVQHFKKPSKPLMMQIKILLA